MEIRVVKCFDSLEYKGDNTEINEKFKMCFDPLEYKGDNTSRPDCFWSVSTPLNTRETTQIDDRASVRDVSVSTPLNTRETTRNLSAEVFRPP
jgi:hypothetical protein